jgi:D-glycero-alpha-D-manno-heptose 1-phosphate guanylyltransferase
MEAIILAGGFGTRLRSLVSDVPKPMAPICGMPLLEILLRSLKAKDIDRVVLAVGYMADKIISYFGESYEGIDILYEQEITPLGTGGAIRRALARCESDHIFIFNGDTYADLEIEALEAQWQRDKNPIIVAREVEDVSRFGLIELEGIRVVSFSEKSGEGAGVINAGCYVFPVHLLENITPESFSLETDFLKDGVLLQHFDVFITSGKFIDIGIPEEFERAQIDLRELTL